MGAKKKHIFDYQTNRNAELGLVISASVRIEILGYLDNYQIMNIPMLEQFIPHIKKPLIIMLVSLSEVA